MGSDVPRRMRRFGRRSGTAENSSSPDSSRSQGSEKAEWISKDLAEQAPKEERKTGELKYWDQNDPSLDELSSSLVDSVGTDSPEETGSKATEAGSRPVSQKQSNRPSLEERRKSRESGRSVQKPFAPPVNSVGIPSNSQEAAKSDSKPIGGMDVKDLFQGQSEGPKKDSEESFADLEKDLKEIENPSPTDSKGKKPGELEELEDLKFDNPEIEKLKKELKKTLDEK